MGAPLFVQWREANRGVELHPHSDAGAHGEIDVNATNGANSLQALEATGAENLAPRVLIANDDSLAEQIHRAHPKALVVKTLSTVFCEVMVNPSRVPGAHTSSTSVASKPERHVQLDGARYSTLHGVLGTFDFNIAVVRAS